MSKLQVPSLIRKHFPAPTKGVVKSTVLYAGTDRVTSFIDSMFGSPLTAIGVNVPVLGRIDAQDIITYMIVAGGARFSIDVAIAYFANKLLFGPVGQAGQSSLRGLVQPIISNPGAVSTSGASSGSTQGAPL